MSETSFFVTFLKCLKFAKFSKILLPRAILIHYSLMPKDPSNFDYSRKKNPNEGFDDMGLPTDESYNM